MDKENINVTVEQKKFCNSCGKELKNDAPFCPYCGNKIASVASDNTASKNTGLIIGLCATIVVLVVALGIVLGVKITSVPDSTNEVSGNNSGNAIDSPENVDNNEEATDHILTADEYVSEVLLKDYNQVKDAINLDYKLIDAETYFDCSNFNGSILGYKTEDFNNDGDEDIFLVKCFKDETEKRDDNYAKIKAVAEVYLAKDSGDYKLCYTSIIPLYMDPGPYSETSLTEHYKATHYYAVHQTSGSNWYLLNSSYTEDDRSLYKDNSTYYSPENSLGDFASHLNVMSIDDNGVTGAMSVNLRVDHISGMPEAESYDYSMGIDGGTPDDLISGGANSVRTGTNIATPIVGTEITGSCASESEACEKINAELDKYELQNYHISPFKWDARYDSSFILDKKLQPIAFEITGTKSDDESGKFYIQLI